jgi:hypothetical protein
MKKGSRTMYKTEFLECFNYMKGLFPRANDSDNTIDIWFDSFKSYTPHHFKTGLATYVKRIGDKTPTIPDIRTCIAAVYGESAIEKKRVDRAKPHFSEIDLCMDAFGPDAATIAIKGILEDKKKTSWTDLVDQKDWISTYKTLLVDLVREARELQQKTSDSDWWGWRSLKNDTRRDEIDNRTIAHEYS